ncbi:hypothetical protein DH2020_015769 [Rehmannia glutinosa]|uniref:BRX domain-containing protein n=1 Tax=Rehmannia glutinosa TaxID=99300 RepID=A0ABR0WWV8_REHGL
MSQIYDNWERLVAAVLRKEELWQLCHADSRNPTTCSDQSSEFSSTWSSIPVENFTSRHDHQEDASASNVWALWEKQYKPGVYITLAALPDGTRFVKRVRFSRIGFEEQQQAVIWWFKNREIVYSRYNALGGIARIRQPSVVTFSSSPLTDHYDGKEEKESLSVPVSSDHEHQASRTRGNEEIFSDLLENEKIALQELKQLVQEAQANIKT